MPIRNIIFDWSGTLVDDLPAVWRASNYVLERAGGVPMSLEAFRERFTLPFLEFYDRHLPGYDVAQLESWYHEHFEQVQHSVEPLPHAREFLEFARESGMQAFLLSAIHERQYGPQQEKTGFHDYFHHHYIGVHDKREKIVEILESHDLDPAETLFIGDMLHDVDAAKVGGVHSCAVLTGYSPLDQLRESGADLIVENLNELRAALDHSRFEYPPVTRPVPTKRRPIATVGALILDEVGRLLMIQTHKWSDLWGIPGGKIEWGETSEEALRRELREETGLEVSDIDFVMVQDCVRSSEFYRDEHFLLLNYLCRSRGGEPKLNEEAQAYRWTTVGEAFRLPLNQPTRRLLEQSIADGRLPEE